MTSLDLHMGRTVRKGTVILIRRANNCLTSVLNNEMTRNGPSRNAGPLVCEQLGNLKA